MADSIGLSDLLRKRSGYEDMAALLKQPTGAETAAQGLVDATANIPQNTFAGGLVQGLAGGYNISTKAKAGKKRDNMTEYLMAQQQYEMERARQTDELLADVAEKKAAAEAKRLIQDNIDLSLDAYQSTGDVGMLNETLNNESAAPLRKLFERQITEQGGVYQGITATPQGDLLPFGVGPDGSRVYGQPMAAEKAYSQGYLTAKQTKDLDFKKAQAGVALEQAKVATERSQAGKYDAEAEKARTGGSEKPLPTPALKLQDEAMTSLGTFKAVNADIDTLVKQIDDGKLSTSLLSRSEAGVRNTLNISDEASRNLSTLDSKLQSMRNAILLLNKGVQTEGDAQRAMDEIINNRNDTALVRQRLNDLKALNDRAVTLQQARVDSIRNEYGKEPMDFSAINNPPSAVGTGQVDLSNPKAAEIRAAFKAGKLTREQAKAQLQALGAQ